jgi:hypothetical protein
MCEVAVGGWEHIDSVSLPRGLPVGHIGPFRQVNLIISPLPCGRAREIAIEVAILSCASVHSVCIVYKSRGSAVAFQVPMPPLP